MVDVISLAVHKGDFVCKQVVKGKDIDELTTEKAMKKKTGVTR